jgi:hypothetical protein
MSDQSEEFLLLTISKSLYISQTQFHTTKIAIIPKYFVQAIWGGLVEML